MKGKPTLDAGYMNLSPEELSQAIAVRQYLKATGRWSECVAEANVYHREAQAEQVAKMVAEAKSRLRKMRFQDVLDDFDRKAKRRP